MTKTGSGQTYGNSKKEAFSAGVEAVVVGAAAPRAARDPHQNDAGRAGAQVSENGLCEPF